MLSTLTRSLLFTLININRDWWRPITCLIQGEFSSGGDQCTACPAPSWSGPGDLAPNSPALLCLNTIHLPEKNVDNLSPDPLPQHYYRTPHAYRRERKVHALLVRLCLGLVRGSVSSVPPRCHVPWRRLDADSSRRLLGELRLGRTCPQGIRVPQGYMHGQR